jgi:hypothetical protein
MEPLLLCESCELVTFSARLLATLDCCPRCGTALDRGRQTACQHRRERARSPRPCTGRRRLEPTTRLQLSAAGTDRLVMPPEEPRPQASLELRLPATRYAPREARRVALAFAQAPAEQADDIRLLVSELITNALQASSPEAVWLTLEQHPDRLRIAACDDGSAAATPRSEGLQIIDALATRWDVDRATGAVWAELDLACAEESPSRAA